MAKNKNKADSPTKKKGKVKKARGVTLSGVTVTVLGPSEAPYATLDEATGMLTLGLPRGEKGEKGPARCRENGARKVSRGLPGRRARLVRRDRREREESRGRGVNRDRAEKRARHQQRRKNPERLWSRPMWCT